MEQYYIIELQHRPDGIINQTVTARSSLAMALSYYYDRKSKMVVNTQFTKVAVMVTDSDLTVIEQDVLETLYQPEAAE